MCLPLRAYSRTPRLPPRVSDPQRRDRQHFAASSRALRRRGGEPFENDLYHGVDVDSVGAHHCLGAAFDAAAGDKLESAAADWLWVVVAMSAAGGRPLSSSYHRHRSPTAGAAGFLNLSQSFDLPDERAH